MNWYKKNPAPSLDYERAIFATSGGASLQYLLVRHHKNGVGIVFDWFNIKDGRFNSSLGWTNPEDAVAAYKGGYTISNGTLIAQLDVRK